MRTRLENGLGGFILTKNLSDKPVHAPEERVHVSAMSESCPQSSLIIAGVCLAGGGRGGGGDERVTGD